MTSKRSTRWPTILIACVVAGDVAAVRQVPTSRPTAEALNPAVRDVVANQHRLAALFPRPADLADPDRRAASGGQAIDALNHIVAGLTSVITARAHQPGSPPVDDPRLVGDSVNEYQSYLVALGDPPTLAAVDRRANGADVDDAVRARRILLRGTWLAAGPDMAKQAAMVDQAEALAKAHPTNNGLADTVASMAETAATPAIHDRLCRIITDDLTSRAATHYRAMYAADAKALSCVGKAMVLNGTLPDGRAFSTADWKGKVVLVDFWASWCGPCKAELPRVRQMYDTYHADGLEVLGVSNDFKRDSLTGYTAAQHLPWPQLFDAAAAARSKWNSIATGFGIEQIPRMFLIDRRGVCRSVTARPDFEAQIPKLLSEGT